MHHPIGILWKFGGQRSCKGFECVGVVDMFMYICKLYMTIALLCWYYLTWSVYSNMLSHTHARTHTHTHTLKQTHKQTNTQTHTHMHACARAHAHTHTHIHTGMGFETLGTLVGIGVYALFFAALDSGGDHSCVDGRREPSIGQVGVILYVQKGHISPH